MHDNVGDFCRDVKRNIPEYFKGAIVLDVGSLDINGNNRYLFEGGTYTGIDIIDGPNVDYKILCHEMHGQFTLVISTEAFEHDMFLEDSLKNIAYNLLHPGGLFLFTCATTGRREHGTMRIHPELSPTSKSPIHGWSDYYRNVTEQMVRDILPLNEIFQAYQFRKVDTDLQFWGVKR